MDFKFSLNELLYKKILLEEEIKHKLSYESLIKGSKDYHASKKPVHCGMTVHSVIGCSYRCTYCYVPDMGISYAEAKPYGLSGEEMVYALLKNPYFLPGKLGTYIALGSVGEPFHPSGKQKTLEYIHFFSKYLHNPLQFSTKSFISNDIAKTLASIKGVSLSPLITLITLDKSEKLEPGAPSPYERLESIKNLRKSGLHPLLFLRPVIPGINDEEAIDVMREAKRCGASGVVIGGFRITKSILLRLEKAGFNTSKINEEIKRKIKRGVQLSVNIRNVKLKLVKEARKIGLIPFLSACCGNTFNAYLMTKERVPCAGLDYIEGTYCTGCPVNCRNIETKIDEDEVISSLKRIDNTISINRVEIDRYKIKILANDKRSLRILKKQKIKIIAETAYRRKLLVHKKEAMTRHEGEVSH
ncbi:MAG: radical SAM protein [Thermoprotei archaeon]|nr:MAG: radical SAM protein [Thermoprotei archaeon]